MPAWFPDAAHELTLGYPGLLAKALTSLALYLLELKVSIPTFTSELFKRYGASALELDLPHINAIRLIRARGRFKPSTLMRHGDWLSFTELAPTHLHPELI
ncbi:hypothetical protein CFB84_19950 [Burkholderia aenigmatica]|uniref:Uncharacterized protein n=2 Tax=Burkholderia aenigmatica TaxID=2015348 RepID=A0A228INT0_9BURK|nr:hypothetical protein CFB84_19950 [Burkholderia aenigmatica]